MGGMIARERGARIVEPRLALHHRFLRRRLFHRRPLMTLAVGALITLPASDASAQQLLESVSISATEWQPFFSCVTTPPVCEGSSWVPPGTYEFDFYLPNTMTWPSVDSLRFALEWPPGWTVLSWQPCRGLFQHGNPAVAGSGILFAFDCPQDNSTAFLRTVVECPTPGAYRMIGYPGHEWPETHWCDQGEWERVEQDPRVEVGDYCGMLPLVEPCDMYCTGHQGSHFDPDTLSASLESWETAIDTILVTGSSSIWMCELLAYCGGSPIPTPGRCFDHASANASWIDLRLIDVIDEYYHYYEVRLKPVNLAPGQYYGRIIAHSSCILCVDNCMDVWVTVEETTGVEDAPAEPVLSVRSLSPNPAAREVRCEFETAGATWAKVVIFDVNGRAVSALLDRWLPAGSHAFRWPVADPKGRRLAPGVYYVQFEAGPAREVRRLAVAP